MSGAFVVRPVETASDAAAVRERIAKCLDDNRRWLLDYAAAEPVRLAVEFRRDVTEDELVAASLADDSAVVFDVTAALTGFTSCPTDRFSAVGLYSSGEVVTLVGRVSRKRSRIRFTVPDVVSIVDSHAPSPVIPSGYVAFVDVLFFAPPDL
jgi:hypothetical protein